MVTSLYPNLARKVAQPIRRIKSQYFVGTVSIFLRHICLLLLPIEAGPQPIKPIFCL